MRARQFGFSFLCSHDQVHTAIDSSSAYCLRAQKHSNSIIVEYPGYFISHIGVFTTQQMISAMDNRYLTAKAAKHLAEFQTNVPATHHQQMIRQVVEFH